MSQVAASEPSSKAEQTHGRREANDNDQNKSGELGERDHSESPKDEEPLRKPSTNIKGDLVRILGEKGFKASGSFYASRFFEDTDAPNPILNLEGVGIVGLPLSPRVAKDVISGCQLAPFGKGERTVVDKEVRDTWEMDGAKVKFDNPAFTEWVDEEVVPQVCESLGVSCTDSDPRAELYKLLLYEPGSHFLSHQDTEKTPGMFATVVIILPSSFTGGSLHLSHAGQKAIIDTSSFTGPYVTHVAAWYTDVFHAVRPVESGYRLALSYNLVHTAATSLRLGPVNMEAEWNQLRHLFLDWKKSVYLHKIVYLLDHMYSESNLQSVTLKGQDAHRVSHLRFIGEQLGFEFFLVNLELHQAGPGLDDEGEAETVVLEEVEDSTLSVMSVFDFNGKQIKLADLELEDEEFIPRPLSETAPAQIDYEGYKGNEPGDADLWYRRTALLIRKLSDDDSEIESVEDYARAYLGAPASKKPSPSEKEKFNRLIRWLEMHPGDRSVTLVTRVLTRAAIRWKSPEMWTRTCTAAKVDHDLRLLPPSIILEDIKALGLDTLGAFISDIIVTNRRDKERLELVSGLAKAALEATNSAALEWIQKSRDDLLHSLRCTDSQAIPYLLEEIRERGPPIMRSMVVPQINRVNPSITFIEKLVTAALSSDDLKSVDVVVESMKDIVSHRLSQAELFPKESSEGSGHYYNSLDSAERPDIDGWFRVIKLGLETGTDLTAFFQRMTSEWKSVRKASQYGLAEKYKWITDAFLPEAMARVISWSQSTIPPVPPGHVPLQVFWRMALDYYQTRIDTHCQQFLVSLSWSGGFEANRDQLLSCIGKLCLTAPMTLQMLATQVVKAATETSDAREAHSLRTFADAIEDTMADHMPLSPNFTQYPGSYYLYSTLRTLLVCGFEKALRRFLYRLTQYKPPVEARAEHASGCLMPVMLATIKLLQNSGLNWPSEPLSSFAIFCIVEAALSIGPKPDSVMLLSDLQSLGCDCDHCQALRAFAISDQLTTSITADPMKLSHVALQLKGKAEEWGFRGEIVSNFVAGRRGERSSSLHLAKPAAVASQIAWARKRDAICTALNSIGPLKVQQQLLNTKWTEVCTHLHIQPTVVDKHPDALHSLELSDQATNYPPALDVGAIQPYSMKPVGSNVAEPASTPQPLKRALSETLSDQEASSAPAPKRSKRDAPPPETELSD